jgi:hypothetical protein
MEEVEIKDAQSNVCPEINQTLIDQVAKLKELINKA